MALAKDLEDEMTCPVHLEYFEEPMQLKCLHLLCKKDVDYMIDGDGLIQCPVCKSVSERRDIKKDFRAKRLVELLKWDTEKLNQQQTCGCEEEPAISWCRECSMYFGKQCGKIHKKMPVSSNHHLEHIEDIVSGSKEQVEKYLLEIKMRASEYERTKDEWVKTRHSRLNSPLLAKIQESEDAIINETKRVHNGLRNELQLELIKGTDDINVIISELDSKLDFIRHKVQILRDVIESDDKKTLLNRDFINELVDSSLIVHGKSEDTQILPSTFDIKDISLSSSDQVFRELQNMKIITNETNASAPHSLDTRSSAGTSSVRKKSSKTSKSKVQVKLPHEKGSDTDSNRPVMELEKQDKIMKQSNIDFAQYISKTFHLEVVHKIDTDPYTISLIRNEIWIVSYSGKIVIFKESSNKSLKKIKSMSVHEKVNKSLFRQKQNKQDVQSVAMTLDGTIVAACLGTLDDNDNAEEEQASAKEQRPLGLVSITSDGLIQDIIAQGHYRDVSHDSGRVYGLLASKTEITVHHKQGQDWCQVKSIPLKLSATRLCAVNDKIFLSNEYQCSVSSYNLNSDEHRQLASGGYHVGEVSRPVVCCRDGRGNVLICEKYNNRMQVLLVDNNTWKVVNVDGKLYIPWDAAVSGDGRIYVISYANKTLSVLQ